MVWVGQTLKLIWFLPVLLAGKLLLARLIQAYHELLLMVEVQQIELEEKILRI